MKTCPRCGATFPEDFLYCDQDGAALQRPAVKRPTRRRVGIALAACVAVCALGVAAYVVLGNYVISRVSASVNSVSVHFDEAGGMLPIPRFYLLLNVNMRNDSFVTFTLRGAQFNCQTAATKLADLSWPSQGEQPVRIPSEGSSTVVLRLNPRITDPLSQIDQIDRRVTARCEGTVALSAWGLSMTRDLSFEERL